MEKQSLIFITGGARSGKSSFAEQYAAKIAIANRRKLYYLATSKMTDDEMRARIERHQRDRRQSGYDWETVECSRALHEAVDFFQHESVILLDCLTVLLANELFTSEKENQDSITQELEEILFYNILHGIDTVFTHAHTLFIVSNEIVYEYVKDPSLVQTYSKLLSRLQQEIVRQADQAYVVEAGIDRKSTRLNSSHVSISYAVFCLKKKRHN